MIKPLDDRILIKLDEVASTTDSGIIIPDSAKDRPQEAEVIAIGSGFLNQSGERIPLEVKIGDRVLLSGYLGNKVKHDGEEFYLIPAREILAVIE